MKNKIYKILIASFLFGALISCSDWFDISPKTNVKADELFETESGFMSALAGIYVSMTFPETYGGNMTFGLYDQLAQIYDKIPDGAVDRTAVYEYDKATQGGYNTKRRLQSMWIGSYRLIANSNNLLKWWDKNAETVILSEQTRKMIRGEALAIRAYVHFDILRGWGPINYAKNVEVRDTKCIPYRFVADNSKQPLLPASEIVKFILKDLNEAKELLSYEKDLNLSTSSERSFRMNYYAVIAEMARVYNYAGEREKAVQCAKEVIAHCGLELQNNNYGDPILFKEMIFGLNMYKMDELLSSKFSEGDKITNQFYTNFSTLNLIFQVSGAESDDMRAKTSAFVKNSDEQKAISRKYVNNKKSAIPLIRLPEMYYIICESTPIENNAADYLNVVRNRRGLSTTSNVIFESDEDKYTALSEEYRKEFYAEGKYFFFLKSRGYIGALSYVPSVNLVKENYVFPLPDDEKQYGWTDEKEDEAADKTANN